MNQIEDKRHHYNL